MLQQLRIAGCRYSLNWVLRLLNTAADAVATQIMQRGCHLPWNDALEEGVDLQHFDVVVVHFDGGSCLASGTAAGGVQVQVNDRKCQAGYFLRECTNNEAEFVGALLGLMAMTCVIVGRPLLDVFQICL